MKTSLDYSYTQLFCPKPKYLTVNLTSRAKNALLRADKTQVLNLCNNGSQKGEYEGEGSI